MRRRDSLIGMNMVKRFANWGKQNIRLIDVVLVIIFGLSTITSSGDTTGLFATYSDTVERIWSVILAIPVLFRHRFPQASALAFVGIVLAQLIFGPALTFSDFLALFMLYAVIVHGNRHNTRKFIALAFAVGLLTSMVSVWVTQVGSNLSITSNTDAGKYGSCSTVYTSALTDGCVTRLAGTFSVVIAYIAITLFSTIVIAYWQRARLQTTRLLQERNASIEARKEEERHIAALAERARIARDMHDVVAHTLSIIIVQSDGGRYAGVHDPLLARNTMETIRHESEHALHDMKRLFGVFGGSPRADYEDITTLIEQARTASSDMTINRTISGRAQVNNLGTNGSETLYHIVQESLTNVRKYAGPNVHVTIREQWSDHGVRMMIHDNGRGASASLDGHQSGYGLMGMNERVETLHGKLKTGPATGGGFSIEANIPFVDEDGSRIWDKRMRNDDITHPTTYPQASAEEREAVHSDTHEILKFPTVQSTQSQTTTSRDAGTVGVAISEQKTDYIDHMGSDVNSGSATTTDNAKGTATTNGTHASADDARVTATDIRVNTDNSVGTTHPVGTADPVDSAHTVSTVNSIDAAQNNARFTLSSWCTPALHSLTLLLKRLRSQPIQQNDDDSDALPSMRFNRIERLSRWAQRHYVLIDIIGVLLISPIMFSDGVVQAALLALAQSDTMNVVINRTLTILLLLPLMVRRRMPELSASWVALVSALQLIVLPPILPVNMFALVSLYSGILYGKKSARPWLIAMSMVDSILFGIKIAVESQAYPSIMQAIFHIRNSDTVTQSLVTSTLEAAGFSVLLALMCSATIALAYWTRSRGTNALVLLSREEALKAEQEQQNILAANIERDRISAAIQNEVSDTLVSVINQAIAGLRMFDEYQAQGEQPSSELISKAFHDIGSQGRDALHRMRELLSILRETGFSDGTNASNSPSASYPEADGTNREAMQLAPAQPLLEQIKNRTGNTR